MYQCQNSDVIRPPTLTELKDLYRRNAFQPVIPQLPTPSSANNDELPAIAVRPISPMPKSQLARPLVPDITKKVEITPQPSTTPYSAITPQPATISQLASSAAQSQNIPKPTFSPEKPTLKTKQQCSDAVKSLSFGYFPAELPPHAPIVSLPSAFVASQQLQTPNLAFIGYFIPRLRDHELRGKIWPNQITSRTSRLDTIGGWHTHSYHHGHSWQ